MTNAIELVVDVHFQHNRAIRGIRRWLGIKLILMASKLLKTTINAEVRQKL